MVLDEPLDLAAVEADDAMLDGLIGPVVVTDEELARVLYAWRRDVESEPFPVLVTADAAVGAVGRVMFHQSHPVLARVADVARVVFRLLGGKR